MYTMKMIYSIPGKASCRRTPGDTSVVCIYIYIYTYTRLFIPVRKCTRTHNLHLCTHVYYCIVFSLSLYIYMYIHMCV